MEVGEQERIEVPAPRGRPKVSSKEDRDANELHMELALK